MNVDTLIHARWIIPVEPENTVFEDYALAIKNDKIVALLNSDDVRNKIKTFASSSTTLGSFNLSQLIALLKPKTSFLFLIYGNLKHLK